MNILVTAAATREYIDDIRFITNESTGRMGFCIAQQAIDLGHNTTIVHGPTYVVPPENAKKTQVVSTQQMIDAILEELKQEKYDILISAAALSDYRPKKKHKGKIPSASKLKVEFKNTKKLLGVVRKEYPNIRLIGFKAEYGKSKKQLIKRCQEIKREYQLEFVVANDVSKKIFDSKDTCATIVGEEIIELGCLSKKEASQKIFQLIESD